MTSPITVQPLTTSVGAVLDGVDMREPLPAPVAAAVRQAVLDHGVVFMRGQDIDLEQFWAFMENFGVPLKEESEGSEDDRPSDVGTADLGPTRFATAVWHADTTSLERPPIATALRAVEVPPFGGDTCWSSMTAAWDALSEPMQRMLDGLTAIHSVQGTVERMREFGAFFEARYTERHAREQVHPVVLTHPETGRKALFVSPGYTIGIDGMERDASDALLKELFEHQVRPEFVYRHRWSKDMLTLWDNRCLLHAATGGYQGHARLLRRITIGERSPVAAAH